jgi:stage II sporulation protein D
MLTAAAIHSRPGERQRPRRLAAAALACLLASGWAGRAAAEEVVRVAVTVGAARATLAAAGLACAPLAEDAAPRAVDGGRADVDVEGGTLRLDGAPVDAAGVRCSAPGPIRHGAFRLDGEVEVRRAAGGLDVVHALRMEDYVAAVAGAEMPPTFPPEALKAQAVAARTFAVAKKLEAVAAGRPWHVGATVVHQVYEASGAVDPRARAAADATSGEVLAYDDEPADAFFHAACGGRTESGAAALGRDRPYLQPVACGRCAGTPLDRWTRRFDGGELARAIGLPRPVTGLRVSERSASGRVARVEVEAGTARATLTGADLRQRVGWKRLPSLSFEPRRAGGRFVLEGRGAGHGAGMCQWGAAGLAREGLGYREILAHYYPGTELRRMY